MQLSNILIGLLVLVLLYFFIKRKEISLSKISRCDPTPKNYLPVKISYGPPIAAPIPKE